MNHPITTVPAYLNSNAAESEHQSAFEKAFDGQPDDWQNAPVKAEPIRMTFSGRGKDYFSLWLTNWILAIVTLGVYSAWAKVRRLQYIHQNTQLAGYAFGFHGEPKTILYGRIIAVVLLITSYLGDFFQEVNGLVAVSSGVSLLLFLAFPWFMRSSMRFYSRNSSYRNVRFSFKGSIREIYKIYLLGLLLTFVTLGLAFPYLVYRVRRYHVENNHWGNNAFAFDAKKGVFFGVYLVHIIIAIGLYMLVIAAASIYLASYILEIERILEGGASEKIQTLVLAGLAVTTMFLFIVYKISTAVTQDWLFKISWNHTRIGQSQFTCDLPVFKLYLLRWFCFVTSIVTLGFFAPFAHMLIAKIRLSSISLIPDHDFDLAQATFDADTTRSAEVADMLDFDISW